MRQYSSEVGMPTDWHLVYLGGRAVGDAGLVMTDILIRATSISKKP